MPSINCVSCGRWTASDVPCENCGYRGGQVTLEQKHGVQSDSETMVGGWASDPVIIDDDTASELLRTSPLNSYCQSDTGGLYRVLVHYHDGSGFARGEVGKNLVYFHQIGEKVTNGTVRTKIIPGEDMGTHVEFRPENGFGGETPATIR